MTIIDYLIIIATAAMGASIGLWRSRAGEACPETRAPWRPERRRRRRAQGGGECFAWGLQGMDQAMVNGGRSAAAPGARS